MGLRHLILCMMLLVCVAPLAAMADDGFVIHARTAAESTELKAILSEVAKQSPDSIGQDKDFTLATAHDMTAVYPRAGSAQIVAGSNAAKALVSNLPASVTSENSEKMPPGRYLIIYRLQTSEKSEPKRIFSVGVTSKKTNLGEKNIVPGEAKAGTWFDVTIPLYLDTETVFEYCCGPCGYDLALDRVYVVRLLGSQMSPLAPEPIAATRSGKPNIRSSEIPNTGAWIETDFQVERGKCYQLTAEGAWTGSDGKPCGPEGTCPPNAYNILGPQPDIGNKRADFYLGQHPVNALIGKFGDEKWDFLVGKGAVFIAPVTAKLAFRMNDSQTPSAARKGKINTTFVQVAPRWQAADERVMIAARIQTADILHFTQNGISWEFGGKGTRVGLDDGNYPTVINGILWWPRWDSANRTETLLLPHFRSDTQIWNCKSKFGDVVYMPNSDREDIGLKFSNTARGASAVICSLRIYQGETPSALKPIPGPYLAKDPPPAGPQQKNPQGEPVAAVKSPIDIAVASAAPDPNAKPVASTPPADPSAIERPEFQRKPKALVKSLTSATAMMASVSANGDAAGFTSDIIATVNPDSRAGDKAGIGILRADGDANMRVALDEAVRAVRLRYPIWEPGHIDLSFGEKFTAHGGRAGVAFALLMLSTLEGFDLDPKCGITGDITVDWKVRKVSGVTAQLRGATLDKCLYAAIPEDNETSFADMALLYGTAAIYDIQVFSVATLQDANAVARKDRPANLVQAIKLFDELKILLAQSEKSTLQKPETQKTLEKILELAPNHLSAKYLLAIAQGKASKTLSVNATLYRLDVILYPFQVALYSDKLISRETLPASAAVIARKALAALRPIAHKDILPLLIDESAYIEAIDQFAANPNDSAIDNFLTRGRAMDARFDEIANDKELRGKLMREGY